MKDTQKAQSVEAAAEAYISSQYQGDDKLRELYIKSFIHFFIAGAQWQQSQSDLVSKENIIELLTSEKTDISAKHEMTTVFERMHNEHINQIISKIKAL